MPLPSLYRRLLAQSPDRATLSGGPRILPGNEAPVLLLPGEGYLRFGMNEDLARIAEEHAARQGERLPSRYVAGDPELGRLIANEYELAPASGDREARRAYAALARETSDQYAAAEATRGQSLSKRVAARRALLARAAETRREPTVQAVRDPQFPELYADPRLPAKAASLFVAPESPHLKSLFGVTREDLTGLALSRDSGVWRPPGAPANPRGTEHARLLMTPDNAARLRETVRIGLEDPYLRSMAGWYPMDPAYERRVKLLGPADAQIQYDRLNNLIGAHSIGSPVEKELSRGTAAYFLDQQGRFPEWLELGANPSRIRGVETAPGTMAHDVQSQVAGAYLAHGKQAGSAKVPAYIAASAAPDYGWQNQFAVGDAHFSRQIGLPDIRRATGGIDSNWTMPEALDINPWFRREVAHRVGVNPVSAQATLWGALSPVTGVNTPIGAPKLEILADLIATKTAPRLGISPERARDLVLTGKTYAGAAAGAATVPTVPYLLQQFEEERRRGRIQ